MKYAKKFLYQSNQWYNDGLQKANIRDLSGAIVSLKKSLQFNRNNIAARNLLGLVYFGRGEVVEALVEWIISKNMRSHENIANYYIKKMQENPNELEAINQAIKKYNQSIAYCQQNGEDLAIIQLKKVVAAHPSFLKAYQLLALLYLQTEQYPKARQVLKKAHRLDTTNDLTLLYTHELQQLHSNGTVKTKKEKGQTVTYQLGNETIIQPVSETLKDNATMVTILNIAIGLVMGVAVVWFLVFPAISQKQATKTNKEIIAYSDQIAAQQSEIDLLKKELEQYRIATEETEVQMQNAQATQSSYEALLTALDHYQTENYNLASLVEELLAINAESLGAVAKTKYDKVTGDVFIKQCDKLYKSAKKSYDVANYGMAITSLEQVIKLIEGYDKGEALLLLADAYQKNGDVGKAKEKYNRVIEAYPDTKAATKAKEAVARIEDNTQ